MGRAFRQYLPVLGLIAAIWAIEGINMITGRALSFGLGLQPRAVEGLPGILLMPVLHVGPVHAAENSLLLGLIGVLAVRAAPNRMVGLSVRVSILTGVMVWILGAPGLHVGASGLIHGWLGLLAVAAWRRRDSRSLGVLIAILFVDTLGTLVLAPDLSATSWEAHLSGLVAGIAVGASRRRR